MARLWTSGAELNSGTAGVDFGDGASGTITVSTSIIRSGAYSYRLNPTATFRAFRHSFAASNQTSPHYLRAYVYIASAPSATCSILTFATTTDTRLISIRMTNARRLQLYNLEDSTQIGSDSAVLNTGQWYLIELKVDTTTLSSTACDARLEGVSFASGTASLASGIGRIQIGNADASSTYDLYVDDIAVNDSNGSLQNSWVGHGNVISLKPNGTGDNNQLESASSNNYQDVDEVTPDDATTYIDTVSDSVGEIDDYNIEDATAVVTNDAINVVQVGVRYAGANSSSVDSFVLRIKAAASGTVEESSAITPNSTSYKTNANSAPFNSPLTLYDLPGSSATPWTKSDLDNAQIGIRKSADSTNGTRISTLWLLVDYEPNPAESGNYALYFDGSSNRVVTPNRGLSGLATGTVEFKFKTNYSSGYQKFLEMGAAIDIGLTQNFGGGARVFGEISGVGNLGELDSGNYADNTEHTVAFSWDGTWLRGYIDGVYKTKVAQSGSQSTVTNNLYIGAKESGSEYLNGIFEELRISNIARYTTESSYTVSTSEFTDDANTLLLHHYNEGSGIVAGDASGYGQFGDIDGATYVTGFFAAGADANVNPSVLSTTSSLQAPSLLISSTEEATVLSSTTSLQTAIHTVVQSPPALTITSSVNAPTIRIDALLIPSTVGASASLSTSIREVKKDAPVQSATAALQSVSLSAIKSPNPLSSTSSTRTPAITITKAVGTVGAISSVETPTPATNSDIIISVSVLASISNLINSEKVITRVISVLSTTSSLQQESKSIVKAPGVLSVTGSVLPESITNPHDRLVTPSVFTLVATAIDARVRGSSIEDIPFYNAAIPTSSSSSNSIADEVVYSDTLS